jgi:protein CpxP
MKTLRNKIVIGLAVLGMGVAAVEVQAQVPEGRHGHAVSAQDMHAKWGQHFARRQARLHEALKLSPAQEAAWTTYQAAIKPSADQARPEHAAWSTLSAPARMEKMIALARQRSAEMEARLPALNAFYAQLTPEQKKTFDANTMGGAHGRGRHHAMH